MAAYRYVPQASVLQREIGALLGLDLTSATEAVARAKILDLVGPAIGQHATALRPTGKQIAFAARLGVSLSATTPEVAAALIADTFLERNREALLRLQLGPGDRARPGPLPVARRPHAH